MPGILFFLVKSSKISVKLIEQELRKNWCSVKKESFKNDIILNDQLYVLILIVIINNRIQQTKHNF